jgi:hypothetical protein
MRIDKTIKAAFAREVEKNRPGIAPFPNYSPDGSGEKTMHKNRRSPFPEIGLAACFIVVFGISVFLKDGVYRSPLANQGAAIAQLFPENPKEVFYEFFLAVHSSF